jgi:hypothetical protein
MIERQAVMRLGRRQGARETSSPVRAIFQLMFWNDRQLAGA